MKAASSRDEMQPEKEIGLFARSASGYETANAERDSPG